MALKGTMRAGWNRNEESDWSVMVGSVFDVPKIGSCELSLFLEFAETESEKKINHNTAMRIRHSKIVSPKPILVTNKQSLSSLPSSQSDTPSHRDVWRIHFMVPLTQGHLYGSSAVGETL